MTRTLTLLLLVGIGSAAFGDGAAHAQQAGGEADVFAPVTNQDAQGTQPGSQTPAKPVKKPKVAAAKPAAVPATPAAGPASDVDQRLQQIEEQIADMQVVVGTMESTGRGKAGGAAPSTASLGGDAEARIGRLETQIQSLGTQMSELANELHGLEAKLQTGAVTPVKAPAVPARLPAAPAQAVAPPAAGDTGFNNATVSQGAAAGGADTLGDGSAAPGQQLPPLAGIDAGPQTAALTPRSNDPQVAYDLAYGLILQQDYPGAEGAFRDYIARFPQAPLASNAYYWFGQTFYARGQYKPAADAFLKGYKTYRTGQKAPDSLLKVAMSLSRLGQKDLACSAFTALDGEFPNASAQIKHLEQSERERAGC